MKQEETYNTPPQDTETQTSNSTTANKRKLFSLNRNRKNMAVSQVKQKLLAEFEPVIKRSEKAVQPVKKWMVANPITTFIMMVIIILLNATLGILFSDNRQQNNNNYAGIIKKITTDFTNDSLVNKAPSNPLLLFDAIADLQSIEQIRDSLDLLLLKKHLTSEDSLAFIELSERLQKIKVR